MTKIYRYCFNNGETAINDFLYQQNITCEKNEIVTTFELSEAEIPFHSVYEYLLRHNIEPISIEVSFSRKEIEEAEWLSVRSTWRLLICCVTQCCRKFFEGFRRRMYMGFVRDWLAGQSFQFQFEYGLEQLRKHGTMTQTSTGWTFTPFP